MRRRIGNMLLVAGLLLLAGCGGSGTDVNPETTPGTPDDPPILPQPPNDPNDPPVVPPPGSSVFVPDPSDLQLSTAFYQADGYDSVDVVRLDVRTVTTPGACTDDEYSGCTLADVIGDTDSTDDFKPEIKVHFTGADYPEDGSVSNAELRQRGATSRQFPQKSFRIKLDSKDVLWRNERRLQLNKHPVDLSRFRNKLSFDLMSEIPHLPSLRTQFVNLWIDDGQGPEDYGLFTHVEAGVKEYLVNRGLGEDDNLYKAEVFLFSTIDLADMTLDEEGEPLDVDLFENRLEIKRGEDHRNLIKMINAVNDSSRTFESVLDQYFNRNNVLAWVTANFLLHQTDAVTHNFYLYNPAGSEKFYFLPWDYDATFEPEMEPANSFDNTELGKRNFYGYARGSASVFVGKYYSLPGIHNQIVAAADEIRSLYWTDTNIAERTDRYATVISPYLNRVPDSDRFGGNYVPPTGDVFAGYVAHNHDALRTSFSIPLSPSLREPFLRDGKYFFKWSPALDVTANATADVAGAGVSYDIDVASTVDFDPNTMILSATGIKLEAGAEFAEYTVDPAMLPVGITLYYRVIARVDSDPERFWQVASNRVVVDGQEWIGVQVFVIEPG